jgi:hypothetical protein
MDSQDLLDRFRQDLSDINLPQLWSDDEVFGYIDEVQKSFVRAIGGIPDSSTPNLAQIAVGVGDLTFKYDTRILKMRSAYRLSDGREVRALNFENMAKEGLRFDGCTGPVQLFVIGMDKDTARYVPIPNVADTLVMVTDRLPIETITADDAPQDLEIDDQHHVHLLKGMKALAYNKQDAETFDKSKSKEFEDKFNAYCTKAFKERERRQHKPRSVTYGGLNVGTYIYPYNRSDSRNDNY